MNSIVLLFQFQSTKGRDSSNVKAAFSVDDMRSLSPSLPRDYVEHPHLSPIHEEVSKPPVEFSREGKRIE